MAKKTADIDTQLREWLAEAGPVQVVTRCPLFADGVSLERGGRRWTRRFIRPNSGGKESSRSLGPISQSYDEVNAAAKEITQLIAKGVDPAAERLRIKQESARAASEAVGRRTTMKQACEQFIEQHEQSWSNLDHRKQWRTTLKVYVYPHIGSVPVFEINRAHVLSVLTPIWHTIPESANRLRNRMEQVLNYAHVRGWRDGSANPAAWTGNLAFVLPERSKIKPVVHHPALPWAEMPTFMPLLQARKNTTSAALMFAILTAARSQEVRKARWQEFDLANKLWIAPPAHMKMRKEHRVPLADAAIQALEFALTLRQSEADDAVVFPASRLDVEMSDQTLAAVLKSVGRSDVTVHGFRSTFRDWAGETGYSDDLAEAALAHSRGKTHGAYQRGDLLQRRREMMNAWAGFCLPDQHQPMAEMEVFGSPLTDASELALAD